jgi:plasmid segregation protein ParM
LVTHQGNTEKALPNRLKNNCTAIVQQQQEEKTMIRAVDVGFGAVKAISEARQIEYPSAVGTFRPIRFTSGMESQSLIDRLCVEFEGKRCFIGSIAYLQSSPRVTMAADRFTNQEGLALMMSALALLSNGQAETVKLVSGLPVNEYAGMKDKYCNTLTGKHYLQLIEPDGKENDFFAFTIEVAKILPQPVGTIFDKVLSDSGDFENKNLAGGRLAVLDIGKHTVDLALTDALQFVDRSSVSFNDIGLFDAFKDLSLALKDQNYDIPADCLEPYIRGTKHLSGVAELKEQAFASQAEKIVSRVINTWPDLWSFKKIFITGGGALLLGDYIASALDSEKVEVCETPTFTNCRGYYKFGKRLWR